MDGKMDQMKIGTDFMKGVLAQIIHNALKKNLEHDVEVTINEAEITNQEEKVHVHLSVDAEITTKELEGLLTKFEVI